MGNKNRKRPGEMLLIEITPETLAKERYVFRDQGDTTPGMFRRVRCIINSIAKDKGWDLDQAEWTDNDGNVRKGLQFVLKTALDVYREKLEMGLKVCSFIESKLKGHTLVVLEDVDGYHCHRYFEIGDQWQHSFDAQDVSLETVWEWLKDPRAMSVE